MGASNPRWKKFERDLARDVGTERIPVTGERDGADFETPLFLYQAKFRKGAVPKTLSEWVDRARTKARFTGRTAVVVVRRHRRSRMEAMVLLTWADWLELHGNRTSPDVAEKGGLSFPPNLQQHVDANCPLPAGHAGPCTPP